LAIIVKESVKDTANVFDHDGSGANLVYKANHRREEVPLILIPQLLSRHGKWRARQPPRDNIYTHEGCPIELFKVLFEDVPFGAVQTEGCTSILVNLH
jgi:hypothetical protein